MLLLVDGTIGKLPHRFITLPLDGFSHNRNAFAFILLLALCCIPVTGRRSRPWLVGILLAGLWFAASRAAWGAGAVLLVVAAYHGALRLRTIALGGAIAVANTAVMMLAPFLSHSLITDFPFTAPDRLNVWTMVVSPSSSDIERFTSIRHGLDLFLQHPFIGAGLGAYIAAANEATRPVIIHSTLVWLLAETGLIGFLAFAIPAIRVLWTEWVRPNHDAAAKFLILILIVFAIESSIDEMLYQRSFWLLLGAGLACVPRERATPWHGVNAA